MGSLQQHYSRDAVMKHGFRLCEPDPGANEVVLLHGTKDAMSPWLHLMFAMKTLRT